MDRISGCFAWRCHYAGTYFFVDVSYLWSSRIFGTDSSYDSDTALGIAGRDLHGMHFCCRICFRLGDLQGNRSMSMGLYRNAVKYSRINTAGLCASLVFGRYSFRKGNITNAFLTVLGAERDVEIRPFFMQQCSRMNFYMKIGLK